MIQTGTTIHVYTGEDYQYNITVDPDTELKLAYIENTGLCEEIMFGSKDEMKAVAEAMLRALEIN